MSKTDQNEATPTGWSAEAAQYLALRTTFDTASAHFNGTRASQKALQNAGINIEKLVHAFGQATGQDIQTAEATLARLANISFDANYYTRLHQVVNRMVSAMYAAYESGQTDALLATLAQHGVIVKPACATMIEPGEGEIKTGSGNGFKIEFEPRLAWLVEALLQDGIARDEFYLDPAEKPRDMVRKEPYVQVNLPGYGEHGRQIVVCNQVDQTTFLSDRIYDVSFYEHKKKDHLRSLPGISTIDHRNHDEWLANILLFIKDGSRPEHIIPIDIKAESQKARPVEFRPTRQQLITKIFETTFDTDIPDDKVRFPSQANCPIPGWAGWTWGRAQDLAAKSLKAGGLAPLIRAVVCEQVKLYRNANPGVGYDEMLNAALPGYPDITFVQIDRAFQNIPKKVTSLWRVAGHLFENRPLPDLGFHSDLK
jgi:hypothetical protein